MKFIKSKKGVALLATLAVAVLAAVGAYAYYTSSGTGTGSATGGAAYAANSVQLSSDAISGLYPGGDAVPVTVHVHNPNPGAAYVDQITGSVADNGGCMGSWFTVAPIDYGQDVAKESDGPNTSTTVTFNDNSGDQDACQNASLTITWSSN
jgi:hypothetical protein